MAIARYTWLLVLACGCTARHAVSPTEVTAVVGVTIIDASSNAPPAVDQTILIDGGVIRTVGGSASVAIPPGARVVDARGKFAIPGLWDMHVHFMNAGVTALSVLVANGVTSVREMGGFLDSTRAWQARMKAGSLVGPRIVTPGPILESPRYLQGVRDRSARLDGRLAARVLPYRIGIGNSADARAAMDSLITLRVEFVKIRTVASADVYFAILREAKRVGLRVSGHLPGVVSLGTASDSGQNSIEHALFPSPSSTPPAERDALFKRFAANGTWYTPTLAVSRAVMLSGDSAEKLIFGDASRRDARRPYASPWLLGWWRMQVDERKADTSAAPAVPMETVYRSAAADVRGMHDAGVHILAGTDAGSVLVYPGFALHEELRLMVEDARLSPLQALRAATIAPAQFLGLESSLGTIAAGKTADIVLLEADPLSDIRNTRRIFGVVQGGQVFERGDLDRLLASVRSAAP